MRECLTYSTTSSILGTIRDQGKPYILTEHWKLVEPITLISLIDSDFMLLIKLVAAVLIMLVLGLGFLVDQSLMFDELYPLLHCFDW